MKRFFIFSMLCLLVLSINAQVPVVIGSGNTSSSVLPSEETFKFSISQQIYTAEEMTATPGTITSVSFKMESGSIISRNIKVYMANTTKESYTHTQDWVNLTQDDLVFSGEVTYPNAGEWLTISLQTPFEYTGGNLIMDVYDFSGYFEEYTYNAKEHNS